MPLPKVSRSLPKWPDPAQSIGRQIMSRRLGRRKAWWPRGPALDIFEKEIHPAIEAILKSVDLCYVDILIIPYMIGRDPDKANPVVMICCTNTETRNDAEVRIRSSGLLDKYPGFGLGAAALPLESSAPCRLLGGGHENQNTFNEHHGDETSYHPYFNPRAATAGSFGGLADMDTDICVTSPAETARLGARLYFDISSSDGPSPYATGGIIIDVAGEYFQLTILHFTGSNVNYFEAALGDLQECHFDVSMDDSSSDEEVEPQCDLLAATSRGSMSPVYSPSQSNTSSSDMAESNTPALHILGVIPRKSTWPRLRDFSPDYSMVRIPPSILRNTSNKVENGHTLLVRKAAHVGTEERAVVVVTSIGPLKGILLPGAIGYRPRNKVNYQKIFQVELEVAAVEGDCGAAVLDQLTGDLYGHLFLGGTGSLVAYFISAIDVFRDISSIMGKPVSVFDGRLIDRRPFYGQSNQSGATLSPMTASWSSVHAQMSSTNEAKSISVILPSELRHDLPAPGTRWDEHMDDLIIGVGTLHDKESTSNERPKSYGMDIEEEAASTAQLAQTKLKATFHEREFEQDIYPRKFRALSSRDDGSSTGSRSPESVFSEPPSSHPYPMSLVTTSASSSNTSSSNDSTISCPECDKTFHGKHARSHLSRHKRSHREDTQIQCPFCDKTFRHNRTDNVRTHCRNVHQRELPQDAKKFWAANSASSKKQDPDN
ncbi:hypothetical protein F4821DRAFT_237693 [Hypoxylon rubiginosum]|uniref:Uncharacterized protein n=1 Tax=Hypoxylon rubiginosum TaxID=110542 RepID=A0ACC0D1Q0_9PEZI|nr:hypothetical protein F4821DRAFT_237693 [Hypoxylon rubiginosum]